MTATSGRARGRSRALARLGTAVRPADPVLTERFDALPVDRRRALVRAAVDPDLARRDPDPGLVRALARAQASRVWPTMIGGFVLALLVLMTIWGFGRSAVPGRAPLFLLVGGVAGLVTLQVTGRRMLQRLARAREVDEILAAR